MTEDELAGTGGAASRDDRATTRADRGGLASTDADDSGPSSADYSLAFTPRQAAVGFAIVAGLIAFALGRRRRRRRSDD